MPERWSLIISAGQSQQKRSVPGGRLRRNTYRAHANRLALAVYSKIPRVTVTVLPRIRSAANEITRMVGARKPLEKVRVGNFAFLFAAEAQLRREQRETRVRYARDQKTRAVFFNFTPTSCNPLFLANFRLQPNMWTYENYRLNNTLILRLQRFIVRLIPLFPGTSMLVH